MRPCTARQTAGCGRTMQVDGPCTTEYPGEAGGRAGGRLGGRDVAGRTRCGWVDWRTCSAREGSARGEAGAGAARAAARGRRAAAAPRAPPRRTHP